MLMEATAKIRDVCAAESDAPKYISLDSLQHAPCQERRSGLSRITSALYLMAGIILGTLVTNAAGPSGGASLVQQRWARLPLRWGSQGPEDAGVRHYEATGIDKLLHLRQQIDGDFAHELNAAQATGGAVGHSNPFRLCLDIVDRIGHDFDQFFQEIAQVTPVDVLQAMAVYPEFDVEDSDATLAVTCALPGLQRDEVSVDLKGQRLDIRVHRREGSEDAQVETSFTRTFLVPAGVTSKDVTATLENGTLRVRVRKPLAAAPPLPSTIPVTLAEVA